MLCIACGKGLPTYLAKVVGFTHAELVCKAFGSMSYEEILEKAISSAWQAHSSAWQAHGKRMAGAWQAHGKRIQAQVSAVGYSWSGVAPCRPFKVCKLPSHSIRE